jgi:hypothetical protein
VFEKHVQSVHSKQSLKQLWDELNDGPKRCGCGCEQDSTWYGWNGGYSQFIRGHNANIYSIYSVEEAKEISEKRKKALKGKRSWAKGLTKETDERIAKGAKATSIGRKKAFDEGKIRIWSKGLTKESDERVAKMAESIKEDFSVGKRISWNKDLTQDIDERIAKKNQELRKRFADGEITSWHSGKTVEDDPRIMKFWEHRSRDEYASKLKWSDDEIVDQLKNNKRLILQSIIDYKNNRTNSIHVRCANCCNESTISLLRAKTDHCQSCTPVGSMGQNEIADFIESLGFVIGRNVRGIIGKNEIDIYVPQKKLAIEFNGMYWHSEAANKTKNYHQGKSASCKLIGISLFHVFEDEWRDKRKIVKSMLMNKLGVTPRKLNARSLTIATLKTSERRKFFEENHIDGDVAATHAICLKLNDEIVFAMSIRKPFHKKYNGQYEIARCCAANYTVVRGAISRLMKYAKLSVNDAQIITYVDTRFGGDGNGYVNAGMRLIDETTPRFWWTDFRNRFNRFKFKANKRLNLSENDVAEIAGVSKIWGCKNLLFST